MRNWSGSPRYRDDGPFVIEKGIPIPDQVHGAEGIEKAYYPFAEMEIGDSFFVVEPDPDEQRRRQNSIIGTARRSKMSRGMHFTTRRDETGVRVWRIPPPDADLERLQSLAVAGHHGTDLGALSDIELDTWTGNPASVGRNPEGEDREDGLRAEHEHAVGSVADETPNPYLSPQGSKL